MMAERDKLDKYADVSIEIRPVTWADFPALATGMRAPDVLPEGHAARIAAQESGKCAYIGAFDDSRPLGHVFAELRGSAHPEVRKEGTAEIQRLLVAPEARRMNLGTKLMDAAHSWIAAEGLTRVGLCVGVDSGAREFYRGLGYEELKGVEPFRSDRGTDQFGTLGHFVVPMERALPAPLATLEQPAAELPALRKLERGSFGRQPVFEPISVHSSIAVVSMPTIPHAGPMFG